MRTLIAYTGDDPKREGVLETPKRVIGAFDELLTTIIQANLAQVTVEQNEDMRRISAWVAILAIPTAVAGLDGMNFSHIPELELAYGYPFTLLVITAICLALGIGVALGSTFLDKATVDQHETKIERAEQRIIAEQRLIRSTPVAPAAYGADRATLGLDTVASDHWAGPDGLGLATPTLTTSPVDRTK